VHNIEFSMIAFFATYIFSHLDTAIFFFATTLGQPLGHYDICNIITRVESDIVRFSFVFNSVYGLIHTSIVNFVQTYRFLQCIPGFFFFFADI
jgi:hypothetical protein